MKASLAKLDGQDTFAFMQYDPDVANLLRHILTSINGDSTLEGGLLQEEHSPEILLDLTIEGIRYTLMRSYAEVSELHISLSPREREIARLVTKGLPNKTIATVLDISPWTVSTHIRRLFVKLSVGSRAEMVAHLYKVGLLKKED
jgi:DNA-binding CsgD family transcriptional regulator